jgi:hypothetical protein
MTMTNTVSDEPKVGTSSTEEEKIEAWRAEQLELAGFTLYDAKRIAARHSGPDKIDIHEAFELLKKVLAKGGTSETATEILI